MPSGETGGQGPALKDATDQELRAEAMRRGLVLQWSDETGRDYFAEQALANRHEHCWHGRLDKHSWYEGGNPDKPDFHTLERCCRCGADRDCVVTYVGDYAEVVHVPADGPCDPLAALDTFPLFGPSRPKGSE